MTAPMPAAPAAGVPEQGTVAPITPPAPGQPGAATATVAEDEGGVSGTDAAGEDLGAWQAAAEMDARFSVVHRPNAQTGEMG